MNQSSEVFMAEYLRRKMSKELPHSKNEPEIERMVDEGKLVEWQTLLNKPHAVKVHYGKAAKYIMDNHADRFIGSRFVLTRKAATEGREICASDPSSFVVKARWCLQGLVEVTNPESVRPHNPYADFSVRGVGPPIRRHQGNIS